MNRIFLAGTAAMLAMAATGASAQLAGTVGGAVGTTANGTTGMATQGGASLGSSASIGNAATVDASAGAAGTTDLKRATRKSRRDVSGSANVGASIQAESRAQTPGGGL